MTEELLTLVGETKAAVEEVKKNFAEKSSVAEMKERLDKIQVDFEEIHKQLQESAERRSTEDILDVDVDLDVAKNLYMLGAKSLTPKNEQNGEGEYVCRVYQDDPVSGQVLPDVVDMNVQRALHLGDTVYIADRLLAASKGITYEHEKARHGQKETFCKYFPELGARWDRLQESFSRVAKTLDSTTSTGADEWVPTGTSSNLLDEVRLQTPEVNLFPTFNQPTNPFDWPLLTGIGQGYIRSEGTAPSAGELTSAKVSFAAKEFANLQKFTNILSEDSIIAIAPVVRQNMIRSLAESLTMAMVNGDTDAANHFDDDYDSATLGASNFPQHGFDGMFQYCLDQAVAGDRSDYDCSAGTLTSTKIAAAMTLMGKYGAGRLNEIALVVGPMRWFDLLVDTKLVTQDVYGPKATILSGEVGRVFGVPVMISHAVGQREAAVHTTGVNTDAQANTSSRALLVNRTRWRLGDRRTTLFEQDKNIESGVTSMIATSRWSFNMVENAGGATTPILTPHTLALINII